MIALYSVPGVLWIPLILKLQSPLDLMVQSGRAKKIASNLRAARLKHFNKPSIFILNKIQLINWKKKTCLIFRSFLSRLCRISQHVDSMITALKRERVS